MRRTDLELVSLTAHRHVEALHELGRRRAVRIAKAVEFWNRSVAAAFRGRIDDRKRIEAAFLREARRDRECLEEIHAIAEGSGIPFEDVFRLNITELRSFAEKCTTLVVPFRTNEGTRMLFAHNEDWDPRRNDVFVLKVRLPEVTYAVVAYDGYLPGLSSGRNSHGVIHAINYLPAPDLRPGLPRIFVTRRLVTARSIDEYFAWLRTTKRAYSQSMHLAEKDRYLGIEVTARRLAIRRPALPAAHANHFLAEDLAALAPKPSPSSRNRQEEADASLSRIDAAATTSTRARTLAREILSNRRRHPYAIWREADCRADPGATLAMSMFSTADSRFEVWRRRPDRSDPVRCSV